MSATELSRPVPVDTLGAQPRVVEIIANDGERAGLAARFGLLALDALEADVSLVREGDAVHAGGRVRGRASQACVVTGEPVPAVIDAPFALRFMPDAGDAAEELELDEADLDTIGYADGTIELGEAVAETFALALDPFPRAPGADAALAAAGVLSEEQAEAARRAASPFAALKALRGD